MSRIGVAAAGQAERVFRPPRGEEGDLHGFQEGEPALAAIAAAPASRAAGAMADAVMIDADRVATFQHFWVGHARIGHVGVDRALAGKAVALGVHARPGAAADRLVILVAVIAEGEIVHRALGGGHAARCPEQGIDDQLAGLHIARHDSGRRARIEQAAIRDDQLDRLQTALVQRNGVAHQAAEDVEHRRAGDRGGGVEIAVALGRGAGEIHGRRAVIAVDRDGDADLRAIVQTHRVHAVIQRIDHPAHGAFGIVLDMAHIGLHDVEPVVSDQAVQFVGPLGAGGELGLHVGNILVGPACRVQARGEHLAHGSFEKAALLHHLHIAELHAFLVDRAREGRHGARGDAADIGVVPS
jgi:hypothetical protein